MHELVMQSACILYQNTAQFLVIWWSLILTINVVPRLCSVLCPTCVATSNQPRSEYCMKCMTTVRICYIISTV